MVVGTRPFNLSDEDAIDVRPAPKTTPVDQRVLLNGGFAGRGPLPGQAVPSRNVTPPAKNTAPSVLGIPGMSGEDQFLSDAVSGPTIIQPTQPDPRQPRTINIKPKSQKRNRIESNPLDGFILTQYHIRLTMLESAEALKVQGLLPGGQEETIDRTTNETRVTGNVTFASTGDVDTSSSTLNYGDPNFSAPQAAIPEPVTNNNDVSRTGRTTKTIPGKNYYNIKTARIETVYAPSENNPLISTMMMIKMQIVEPHGFKLHEDIRNMAKALNYTDINPGRVLYRVDVHFRGFDQDTGEWHNKIPISPNPEVSPVISYYVAISKIEANVTNTGTVYELDMVPAGHYAYRPEEIVLAANNLFSGESATFGQFLDNLETSLKEAKKKNTRGIVKRNFKFYAPGILRQASFRPSQFGRDQGWLHQNMQNGGMISVGKDVDLLTILNAALSDLKVVQDLFINYTGKDDPFLTPRVHWNIRFNTKYNSKPNRDLNDYDEITYEYIIEPFLTFKKGTVTADNVKRYTDTRTQLTRVREILNYNMLVRIYNYLYTAENTEVLDFNVHLKTFYYETLNEPNESAQASGKTSTESANSQNLNRQSIQNEKNGLVNIETTLATNTAQTTVLEQLFGDVIDIGSGTNNAYDVIGGGFGVTADNYAIGSTLAENDPGVQYKRNYLNYVDDHLRNDLLVLDGFKIRGDPVWLLSPYASASLDTENSETFRGVKIYYNTGKVIFVKMFAPGQDDLANPQLNRATSRVGIIGGFYEVTTVTSQFDGGVFYQSINGVKMNHLNFVEDNFDNRPPTPYVDPTKPRTGTTQVEPQQMPNVDILGNPLGF